MFYPTKDCYSEKADSDVTKNAEKELTERDIDVFRAQMRVIIIKIGDDKVYQSRKSMMVNSRPSSAASIPDGFYCPRLPSPDQTINCSTISITPTNVTLPAKRKL